MRILRSVRFKLAFIALFTVLVITSLIVWSDIRDTKERIIEVQKGKTILLSDIIRQSIMLLMMENRWKELQTLIEELARNNPELKDARIFHPSTGRIIVSSDKKEIGGRALREDWDKFEKEIEKPFVIKKNGDIYASRVISIKNQTACFRCHSNNNKILGALAIDISLAEAEHTIIASSYRHFKGLAAGFIIISLILLVSGEKLINRPLRKLTEVMKKVELGDLSARADGDRKDDFGYLAGAFNNMIDALVCAKKEIELCHLQQMEKAAKLASLGEVVSGIAHEIKNPLTGISCAIQVFHSEMAESDSRKEVITEILNQVKRLDRIVKDLLTYARPKPPHFLSSSIRDVLERALFFVYNEAKKQNVVVNTVIDGDLPEVMMDPDQMQQVFLNIIINAIQAMPSGGTLDISATERDCAEANTPESGTAKDRKILAIEFRDTGKGIKHEDLEFIFDPFFTKKSKGTGLGLSISQRIVQEHGGRIVVSSQEGRGSIFSVYLPVRS